MATRKKRTSQQYRNIAKRLSQYSPDLKSLSKKPTLSASDKRKISRLEHNAFKAAGSGPSGRLEGNQRVLIPISQRELKKLKDKSILVPGLNAIVDRFRPQYHNTKHKAVVRNGELYVQENGKYIKIVPANFNNPDHVADVASGLFQGQKRRKNKQVWVRFKNGRSDQAFETEENLFNFLQTIYQKYNPLWEKEGVQIDDMVEGFEVYEQPTKGKKTTKRKPASKPARKPARRTKSTLQKLAKTRTRETATERRLVREQSQRQKKLQRQTADLLKAARASTRAVAKPPRKRKSKRGTTAKNRRH